MISASHKVRRRTLRFWRHITHFQMFLLWQKKMSDWYFLFLFSLGIVAEQFLSSTATQLTYHGLCELTSTVQEGELCVFFRNNHFSTMIKHKVPTKHVDNLFTETRITTSGACQISSNPHMSLSQWSKRIWGINTCPTSLGWGSGRSFIFWKKLCTIIIF